MDWKKEYDRWLKNAECDPFLMEDMMKLADDKSREESFYTELEFGTAGLRGIIGAGTNRMNAYVVRRASRGLAQMILDTEGEEGAKRGVAIAYDSRNRSDIFAQETALTLCACGIKVYLYSTLHSVPQLSFTVRHLGCIAGVVITASHNPPEYNGYKVYWADGGQCAPDRANRILENIRKFDYFDVKPMEFSLALSSGLLTIIGKEVDEEYYKCTMSLLLHPENLKKNGHLLSAVYSPLHGSGRVPVTEILKRVGVTNLNVVPEQAEPNGDFPTVKAPNPEDKNAFTLARQLADKVGANLMFATDPDSDRLGVAVRQPDGDFKLLTGNQTGALLTYYILSSLKEQGRLPANGLVVKSFVSTTLADAICKKFGVTIKDVLTGFRFISEWIEHCAVTGEYEFLFGFEESYGALAGGFARDKDAICASMLVCDAAAYYMQDGRTLYDVMTEVYREFGFSMEKVKNYSLSGKEGIEKIAGAMRAIIADPVRTIGGEPVLVYENHNEQTVLDMTTGAVSPTGLPKSNALRYMLPEGAWAVVRPSGTEPKLKLYIGAAGKTEEDAVSRLDRLMADMDGRLTNLLK
ncbi:MAG: phospho-sugar mutase [Clostridiales bacterium]|nr:phospho-sugar mutase [Clostridiales bacterium]